MTPQEIWMKSITDTITKAGYSYKFYCGFPLIETPKTIEMKQKLLELKFEYVAYSNIYAEGMIITPVKI